MPKLEKTEVENLFRNPHTQIYYVRVFRSGKGELVRSTKETDLEKAKKRRDDLFIEWGEGKHATGKKVSVGEIAELCLDHYAHKAERTYESFESVWELHLKPYFAQIPVDEVGKRWPKYRIHEKRLNPSRALTHDRRYMRFILGWAEEMEAISGVPKLKIEEKRAEPGRELTLDEIVKLLVNATPKQRLKLNLKLLGMRDNEVRVLRYDYIDFTTRIVNFPEDVEKRRIAKRFALSPELIAELKERAGKSISPFVFPHRDDPERHETRNDHAWQRLKKTVGVDVKGHWTRYTAVTEGIRAGKNERVMQKAFGMSDKIMKEIYHKPSDEDLRGIAE